MNYIRKQRTYDIFFDELDLDTYFEDGRNKSLKVKPLKKPLNNFIILVFVSLSMVSSKTCYFCSFCSAEINRFYFYSMKV